jgi:histidinol-phosphatase
VSEGLGGWSCLMRAVGAAEDVAPLIMKRFRDPALRVDAKGDGSPVTDADREAEEFLRERFRSSYPMMGILGEETGETEGDLGARWIIDPIDGTRSFVRGVPLFATLIALEWGQRIHLGVIHLPALGETVYAARGLGAWWRTEDETPRPARVSPCGSLDDALLLTTSIEGFARRGRQGSFEALAARARHTRTWGDAYGYALVATGRAEIMVDPGMAIWDAAPLLPILEEAGGTFTDWRGERTAEGGNGVATNGLLHDDALRLLGVVAGGEGEADGSPPPESPGP